MVIAANIIDFVACILMVATGSIKKKGRILGVQIIQMLMQGVSTLLLGAFTGVVNNLIACLRNYLCYKDKLNIFWKAGIISVSIVLTELFNDQGLLGIIPLVICTVYILLMDLPNPIHFKLLVTSTLFPWTYYHFCIGAYTAAVFDMLCIVTNVITITAMMKEKKAQS